MSDQDPEADAPGATPASEEELQRRLEEQIRQVRVQDLLLESLASILNLSARRIAKEDERDLEQGRIGIEAVRALLDLVEPEAREQVQEALAQVQMLYVRESKAGAGDDPASPGQAPPPSPAGGGDQPGAAPPPGPGPGPPGRGPAAAPVDAA